MIYGQPGVTRSSILHRAGIMKHFVDGVEQDFAVLQPQELSLGTQKIPQVTFVKPMRAVGDLRQAREDGTRRHVSAVAIVLSNKFA
jgi:hypothetical protein